MDRYDRTESNLREYKGFTIRRLDPYGFWEIFDSKGKHPIWGSGAYTQVSLALKAIETNGKKG